jgi:flagellar hook protein FlgE
MDGEGNILYTRAGVFSVDEEGYLVNSSGYHVLGISGDSEGQNAGSEIIRITVPDTQAKCSTATKEVNGTNVTLSMSAPSDVSDMSVTFNNSEYPYATYANGILNIFMNMDEQYNSEAEFQTAINQAISAGGITLPDDLNLNFEFETIPNNPEAVAASNSITWSNYSTTSQTMDACSEYTFTATDGSTETKTAQIAFSMADVSNKYDVKLTYNDAGASVSYAAGTGGGTWTINVGPTTGVSDINKLITEYMDQNPDAPKITCTAMVLPSASNDNRKNAIEALNNDTTNNFTLAGGQSLEGVSVDVSATVEGEYANNYKIVFAYSSTYGDPKAVWDENTLTITVTNDCTIDDIQRIVTEAAGGNTKRELNISGMSGLSDMNAAMRKAFFGGNPSISLGGGSDSFFTEVLNSLSTFNLTDGRTGSSQSYKDLEDITIQTDGTIVGYHAVHGYLTLGRIDIATFDNPNGLTAVGGTMFAESVASGAAKVSIAGESGAGSVISGALEMSNVDLSQEFTDMITTQRGFQANSRVITTSDTMLEELLSLKR